MMTLQKVFEFKCEQKTFIPSRRNPMTNECPYFLSTIAMTEFVKQKNVRMK